MIRKAVCPAPLVAGQQYISTMDITRGMFVQQNSIRALPFGFLIRSISIPTSTSDIPSKILETRITVPTSAADMPITSV